MRSLLALPPETIDQICDCLASDDLPSVYNFALTDKQCLAIANRHRFAQIHFTLVGRDRLERDIQRWNEILENSSAFLSVRSVTVRGALLPIDEQMNHVPGSLTINQEENEGDLSCLGSYYRRDIDEFFTSFPNPQYDMWSSLQSLVCRLSCLRDMTWSCVALFPPCLLETLQQSIPHCRLHVMAFKLLSLCYNNNRPIDIDQYEYQLATSPSLSSILVPVSQIDYVTNFNAKAAIELAKGLAPNLSRVHIVKESTGIRSNPAEAGDLEWRGFFQNGKVENRLHRGNLQSLSLSSVSIDYFTAWQEQNAFSTLRVLQLWDVSENVLTAAASCHMPLLKSLTLSFPGWKAYDEAASVLVSSLRPLEAIRLSSGRKERTFQAAIRHHGKSLTMLSLLPRESDLYEVIPSFTSWITEIRLNCTNIRSLQLSVHRRTLKQEGSLFRAIGSISHLTNLSLRLICDNDVEEQESLLNALDYPNSEPELSRVALQNSALHSSLLAQAIFFTVAQESSLQRLTLAIRCTLYPKRVAGFLNWSCCRWRCLRASENRIIVRELEKDENCSG
ncbi:uncharacterized protein N7500_001231 [Penicillium coprophilum]|uniref:uncharacterized protein n=1 Tax=Penicillium coprophilum TaxID=36646 RepID=UPI00238E96BF|nr:uncharacterized protein N7500_001231 [Penicillium coprophilum]KAJ5178532.1 hypothetical protein N7500_001231 [Penicillium coprophilum]